MSSIIDDEAMARLENKAIRDWLDVNHPPSCACKPCDAMRRMLRDLADYECDLLPTAGAECQPAEVPCPPCLARRLVTRGRC